MELTIRIENLTTGYTHGREKTLISSMLNGELYSGEFVCLIGPNGAGKTTLLRTLSGFQPPLGGEVEIMGNSLRDIDSRRMSRLVSVVLTAREMPPNLTVKELVLLGRSPYSGFWGKATDGDIAVAAEAMAMVGVENLASRRVSTLSDGECQRAFIAKALAQQTPVMLLDEPSAFLDYPSKFRLFKLMAEIAAKYRKTILLSTHDLEIAFRAANKIWVMNRQRELYSGTVPSLAAQGILTEAFSADGLKFDAEKLVFE